MTHTLDQPLQSVEGHSSLILDHLVAEGYDTIRSLLIATPEKLAFHTGSR